MESKDLIDAVHAAAAGRSYPAPDLLRLLVRNAIKTLSSENETIRPLSHSGLPGGIVRIDSPYVAIVPDLHGRADLLDDLLRSPAPVSPAVSTAELIVRKDLTLICLGDVLNTEGRESAERWVRAARHIAESGDEKAVLSAEMDEEMGLSLRSLEIVMKLKTLVPENFHCLKGNHDNIGNLNDGGDASFYKYAYEGAMGAAWFFLRYGLPLLQELRRYERLLPLLAVGNGFCASHAEPAFPLTWNGLLDYRDRPEVVRALIWTGNGEAREDSVRISLEGLLGSAGGAGQALWFSGHRPIAGTHALRASGRLVQIHNPSRRQIVWLENSQAGGSSALSFFEIGREGEPLKLLDSIPRI